MAEQHSLAFVDSIAASPTIRLSLQNGTMGPWNLRDGSRFDPPPLKRSIPQSLLADGGTPTNAVYDNRTIVLVLQPMTGGKFMQADAAAAQIQLLLRELDRPWNILKYQAGTAAPVFFRTYRAGPDAVDFGPLNREITVTLLAEPFAYGLEETLTPVAVTNDPASGMVLDIASPKGDVETPLTLTVAGTIGTSGQGQKVSGIAVRRRGTPSSMPFVLQAEAMTQGLNTTTQTNSALMSGASNNYSRCTFGTATMQTRLGPTLFPSSPSVNARGQYRVYARVRQTVGTDVIDVRLLWGSTAVQVTNATTRLFTDTGPGAPTIKYVDLNVIQIPVNYDPVYDGLTGVELATEGLYLTLQAQRVSGTGNLDVDLLLLWPVDDRAMLVQWPAVQNTGTDVFVAEGGVRPAAYCLNVSGQLVSTAPIGISGIGGTMITPGRANRVFFAHDLGSGTGSTSATGAGDVVTNSLTVTPSYIPRYLAPVRPVST